MVKTTRLHRARPAAPNRELPIRDPNPTITYRELFGSNGTPGALEEMVLTHTRVAARVYDVRDRVAARKWIVAEPDNATEDERAFSTFCDMLLQDMRQDVENDVGSLGDCLAAAFSSIWFGHWVGEIALYADETATSGLRLGIYSVNLSTISRWVWKETYLSGIVQQTSRDRVDIDREDLVIVHYGENFPVGQGRLRPALFNFEAAKGLSISFSEQAASAKGKLIAQMDGINSQEQIDRAMDMVVDLETEGGVSGVIIGGNTGIGNVEYRFPTSLIDPTVFLRYFDAEIDQLFNSSLNSLGLTAGSGSRALGTELSVADEERWNATMNKISYTFGKTVFRWISNHISEDGVCYTGRLPTLRVMSALTPSKPEVIVDTAVAAVESGLLAPTEEVKQVVKEAVIEEVPSE